jgi:hypothetical protein
MQIGSDEHKELFCRTFLDTHRPFEPADLPWPDLDELSLARLRAIPVWSMALEVEFNAGSMLAGFAATENDALVRRALELQGYEEARHGRILAYMIQRYGLTAKAKEPTEEPTRRAFVHFGYNECVDSFAGFGIFRLACEARLFPESLTSIFTQVLSEEARHIVFFVNWIAWDRDRRGLRGPVMQAIPALVGYGGAIARRVSGGGDFMGGGDDTATGAGADAGLNLCADVMENLTATQFLRACIEENDRYMRAFDPRLLRPRVVPALGRIALAIMELIERIRAAFASLTTRSA